MALFERLRRLFALRALGDDARKAYQDAKSTAELLRRLDDVLTRNEVELGEVRKEVDRIESAERGECGKVREGKVEGRQKRYTLQTIKRLRHQLDNLEHRMAIYDRNITLHLNLIAKVQDMQAMSLRGVEETQIDEIITEFEQQLGEFTEAVRAGEASLAVVSDLVAEEDQALRTLEGELTGAGAETPARPAALVKADRELAALEREIRGPEPAPPAPAAPDKAKRRKTAPPEAAG